jgi:hypothetical protein
MKLRHGHPALYLTEEASNHIALDEVDYCASVLTSSERLIQPLQHPLKST